MERLPPQISRLEGRARAGCLEACFSSPAVKESERQACFVLTLESALDAAKGEGVLAGDVLEPVEASRGARVSGVHRGAQ